MSIGKGKVADALAIGALICFAIAYLTSTQPTYAGAKELIEIMVIFGVGFLVGFTYTMYGVIKGQGAAPANARAAIPIAAF